MGASIMPAIIELQDFPSLLKPGMTVFVQGAASEPTDLLSALGHSGRAFHGVHFTGVFLPGVNKLDLASLGAGASATYFFVTPENTGSVATGQARFVPLHYSRIPRYFREMAAIDIALIQVAPPDERGQCSLGVSVDFVPGILERAGRVVAEINQSMPSPPGSPTIPFDRIDIAVRTDHPLLSYRQSDASAEVTVVGTAVAALIDDGDVIETGIGKVPTAVLQALGGKRDLGIHSGMISDPVIELMESGVVTGARKSIDQGKVVTGIALGTDRLFNFVRHHPDILFRPVDYTHSVAVLAQIDNFVAINSAIEVDLFGQVNGETLNGRQVSGVGGLVDFMRGARESSGGRSIIALTATGKGGEISRIVPALKPGQTTTTLRVDVDFVVTEHGTADLRYKSVDERAAALMGVAAPRFRQMLEEAWGPLRRAHLGH
ncbi:MAG: acetyl-CoA hydrolase/transferase family protein [Pseudorhodoplanes sp.]|nr:MAG: acetyl-CoA hydrolase/transferase family protein [Pseudorhodoplanes sp.]